MNDKVAALVRFTFSALLGALFASSWWAAGVWGSDYSGLWAIPSLLSIAIGMSVFAWCENNDVV